MGVEVQAHGRQVGRDQGGGPLHALHQGRILPRKGQVLPVPGQVEVDVDLVAVGQGHAVEPAVADDVDPLRRQADALGVVAVVGGPQLVGHRVQGHAYGVADAAGEDPAAAAVGVEAEHGPALGIGVPAHVARPAHADVELILLLVEDDGARGVPSPLRQGGHEDLPVLVDPVAVAVGEAHHPVGLGDVHRPLVEGQAVGALEPAGGDDGLVGDAVAVPVGQGHDRPGSHVGHVKDAVGAHRHEARPLEAVGGEDGGREPRGEVEDEVAGKAGEALRHMDRDRLQLQVHARRQLKRTRRVALFARQASRRHQGQNQRGEDRRNRRAPHGGRAPGRPGDAHGSCLLSPG